MKKRPVSVSIISWLLIVMGGISVISTTMMIHNPMMRDLLSKSAIPIPVQFAISYIGLLIMITSGIAMLKGCNWARILYTVWGATGLAIGIVTSPMKMALIPGIVCFAIVVFFLFRPKATAYFSPAEPSSDAPSV